MIKAENNNFFEWEMVFLLPEHNLWMCSPKGVIQVSFEALHSQAEKPIKKDQYIDTQKILLFNITNYLNTLTK